MSDLFNLYADAGSPSGDDQPQSAQKWAANEITTLRQQLEQAEARVAELEAGLEGIANCAYGYSHPKAQTADEAASWMNDEAMRLLGEDNSKGFMLRKQAEAVEAAVKTCSIKSATDDSKCYSDALLHQAQRLHQQADEAEK